MINLLLSVKSKGRNMTEKAHIAWMSGESWSLRLEESSGKIMTCLCNRPR